MESSSLKRFSNLRAFYVTFIVTIGSFLLGASVGYSSPAAPDINSHPNPFHMDTEEVSWFVCLCDIGGIFGVLLTTYAMEHYGRKLSIMLNIVLYSLGYLVIVISPNAGVLFVGRFVTGMGMGALNLIVPVYVAEIAPARIRGRLCACHALAFSLGYLYIHCINFLLSWTWSVITLSVITLLYIVLMLFVPESPRWLLANGHEDTAAEILQWLRCRDSSEELREIRDKMESNKKSFAFSRWSEPRVYKPACIILILILGQVLGGAHYIFYYTVSFFAATKTDNVGNLVQAAIIGASSIIGNFASFFLLAYLGRRIILILSACLMTICMLFLGLYFHVQQFQPELAPSLSWLPLPLAIILITTFNIAWAPVPILLMAELLPVQVKAVCGTLAIIVMYIASFVVVKFSATLQSSTILGYAGLMWLYAAGNLWNAVFTFIFVPETKGKTLEDIECFYAVTAKIEIPKILPL